MSIVQFAPLWRVAKAVAKLFVTSAGATSPRVEAEASPLPRLATRIARRDR